MSMRTREVYFGEQYQVLDELTLMLSPSTKAVKHGFDARALMKLANIFAFISLQKKDYLIIRPIIQLHSAWSPKDGNNAVVSDIVDWFKKRIGNEIRKNARYSSFADSDVLHFWALECSTKMGWHYHLTFFIPKRHYKSTYTPHNLFDDVMQSYCEHKQLSLRTSWPKKNYPGPLAVGISKKLTEVISTDVGSLSLAFKVISYSAKVQSKEGLFIIRRFGASNLKGKIEALLDAANDSEYGVK